MGEGLRRKVAFVLLAAGLLAGCTAVRPMGSEGDPGFWLGLWHGIIAPITFVISLLSDSVRMYAFPNVGRWYDFGFLFGISVWGGGGGAAASRRR